MDSTELFRILKRFLSKSSLHFLGIYASDNIPDLAKITAHLPCCYVANTDPVGSAGTHWIAVIHENNRSVEFFDSCGHHPLDLGFHFPPILRIHHNSIRLQSAHSQVCGQYCLYFLIQRSLRNHMLSIVKHLKSKTNSDIHVSKFIHKLSEYIKNK